MGSSGPHDFTNTSSLELPNHGSGNPFGGNAAGQAAAAGPHGAGSPFASSSGIGSAAPAFGGGSSPFGGGGGMGDNIQKLIKSNTDLITALNNLTKAVRGESGAGGGGMGGLGLGGGQGGIGSGGMGGLGSSALDRQLLYGARAGLNARQARGSGDVFGQQTAGGGRFIPSGDEIRHMTPFEPGSGFGEDQMGGVRGAFAQGAAQAGADTYRGRPSGLSIFNDLFMNSGPTAQPATIGAARNFARGLFGAREPYVVGPAPVDPMIIDHPSQAGAARTLGEAHGARRAQEQIAQEQYQVGQGVRAATGHYTKQFIRGTRDYGFRLGAATSVVDMAAATPFVGGALAAPIGSLQAQGMQAAILELPAAMMSAFGPAFSRGPTGMGAVTRHKDYLTEMAGLFGIDAKGALDMARETLMQGSGGYTTTEELVGSYVTAFGAGFDPAAFARNASFRMAGSNLQNTRFGSKRRLDAIGMAAQLGLKGAGASQFVGGVESMGAMFRNMGIDMQAGTYDEVMKLALSGYTSLSGIGAVEAYGRIRQKTTIGASQSLNSMFGGIANDIMMAQAIMESGGDLDKASALLEGASIAGGKGLLSRGTGLRDGSKVFELLQMGQGLTVAERRYGRMRTGTIGGLDVGDVQGIGVAARGRRLTNDIDISAKLAQDRLDVLENFQTGVTKEGVKFTEAFKQLTDQNKAIEKAIIEGIAIKDFEKIVQAAQKINEKLQYVPKIIDWILKKIGV